jgi:hypothetical protein
VVLVELVALTQLVGFLMLELLELLAVTQYKQIILF